MSEPRTRERICGWGRFPSALSTVYRPESAAELAPLLSAREERTYIAYGLGRSYGDTPINDGGGVVVTAGLDRMVSFDPETGTVECEAGVSLKDLIDTFLPRGWFLPVTPGTKFVTVGGAIANDVHGKNHHIDGAFSEFVEQFTLLAPTGETLTCSRTENADVFWATVGGIGLTGFMLTARLKLRRVETAYAKVDYHRTRNLQETLDYLHEHDEAFRYSVAWIDCLASGKHLGRSVAMLGDHAQIGDLPPTCSDPFDIRRPLELGVPIDFPSLALNRYSIRAFNEVFYGLNRSVHGKIVDYERYFYPLDAIDNWNRIYGSRGFVQYQFIVPPDAACGLETILQRLSGESKASFLAVLKRSGPRNDGLLSFPAPGYMLALDIPMSAGLIGFLREMDRIVLDHGGRLYLAKDATATAETFRQIYGDGIDRLREIRRRLDPDGLLSSSQARRLGIVA